jgi:hypothetical protein
MAGRAPKTTLIELSDMTSWQVRVRVAAILVAVCCVVLPSRVAMADGPVYSTQEEIFADSQAAPCEDKARLDAAIALFKRAGASDADICVFEDGKIRNVVVTLRGSGSGFLVVGAHYDKADIGCGAIDNWSGVVLVAHVYKTLRQLRPNRTILFVAFGEEETGLRGSHAMVKAIAKPDRAAYCAMVNLDSFGLARPQVLENVTSPKLLAFVRTVADKAKVPIASATLAGVADADSSSFKAAGIPAVTLHGLPSDWDKIIHTAKDQAGLIHSASMYLGYVLTLNLVAQLDSCECGAFR